jgi:hypothetical protein
MGFRAARQQVIQSLLDGNFQIEAREAVESRNLLELGLVTPAHVVELLRRCRGDQYESSPHHLDSSVSVHVFRP